MKNNKRYLVYVFYIMIGAILLGLGFVGIVDEFWNGMGFAFIIVGAIQLLRMYRLYKNEAYREKIEIEYNDERNHFLRNKAWAWAGYLFVMIMAVACIILRIMDQDVLSLAASGSVCLMLVLFWGSFYILKRKY